MTMQTKNTLLLIDGSSFIFRAFYALPNLKTSTGFPTGAIRGVFNMINNLQKKINCQHCVCVFDAQGKSFRHEIFPEYKANRQTTPEDLILQFDPIYNIVKAMGISVVLQPGIEADDIIGTVAINAKNLGFKVIIATGDKDFAQLVDDDIVLINTMLDEILDVNGIKNKFGVLPSQIIDYLTLTGDKADNIPGVYGCGEKTAAKWLNTYTNIDNLIKNIKDLKGNIADNVKKALNWLPIAKKLVTIDTKIELNEIKLNDINSFTCTSKDTVELIKYFHKFEFKSLITQYEKDVKLESDNKIETTMTDYIKILDVDHFEKIIFYLESLSEPISLLLIDDNNTIDTIKYLSIGVLDQVYIFEEISLLMIDNYDLLIKQLTKLLTSNNSKILINYKETLKIIKKI